MNSAENKKYNDKNLLEQSIILQKHVTTELNNFIGECDCQVLKDDIMNILEDEHKIMSDIFLEIKSHGWYTPQNCTQEEIKKVYDNFKS